MDALTLGLGIEIYMKNLHRGRLKMFRGLQKHKKHRTIQKHVETYVNIWKAIRYDRRKKNIRSPPIPKGTKKYLLFRDEGLTFAGLDFLCFIFPRHGFNETHNTVGIMEYPCRVQSCFLRFDFSNVTFSFRTQCWGHILLSATCSLQSHAWRAWCEIDRCTVVYIIALV